MKIAAATALISIPAVAMSAAVDLSSWTEDGTGNWNVQAGNDSVLQTVNTSTPAIFYEAGSNSQGTSLAGDITVKTNSDDDFIGFVLGYQSGESTSASADFWLIDWKQGDQNLSQGFAARGLALSHVTDGSASDPFTSYWPHANGVNEVQRGATLGSTGWTNNTSYSFELVFTSSLIQVLVDGVEQINYTSADHGSSFTDGAFGFYNFSQETVEYSAITEDVVPVNTPASLALILSSAAMLFAGRRFRKRG